MAINKRLLVKPPSTGITPSEHFGVVLYEGDGSSSHSINGGKFGAAGYFNGTSSKINTGYIQNGQVFSCSFWGKDFSAYGSILRDTPSGGGTNTRIDISAGATSIPYAVFYGSGSAVYLSTTGSTPVGWHHYVITADGSTAKLYMDGVEEASISYTQVGGNNSTPVHMMSNGAFASGYGSGKLDQVRIFQKALSSSEVSTLYAETASTVESLDPLSEDTTDTLQVLGDSSCIATYRFENNEDDLSSNYNGTGTQIQYAAGRYGQAASFNGTTSQVTTSNMTGLDSTTISLSAWVYFDAVGVENAILSRFGTGGHSTYQILLRTTASNVWSFATYDGTGSGDSLTSTATVSTGRWYHAVVVADGTSKKIYVNGEQVASKTVAFTVNTSSGTGLNIGGRDDLAASSTTRMNGRIDQIRIFNKALSASEVTTLYNENSLVASYRFEGNANDDTRNYDGTASNVTYEYGFGFTPDWLFTKRRDSAGSWLNFDSSRGASKYNFLNLTSAEGTGTNYLLSFDDGGFTVGNNTGINTDGADYVAFGFKANGGTTVTNTDGDVTSTLQVNQDAGFSIGTWTGTGVQNASIGHGLSQAPEIIIYRNRSAATNWDFMTTLIDGSYDFLYLNLTNAAGGAGETAPTDTLAYMWSGIGQNRLNDSYVGYFFHSVAGFSKFGSYTGNASDNGPIIETGFEPAFVMIKSTSATGNWVMLDNKRQTTNPRNKLIWANLSNAETDFSPDVRAVNFYSNGFQPVSDGLDDINDNNVSYIYMAFAADPDTEAPTVAKSFSTVSYTGTGATQSIEGLGFSPSLVWLKNDTYYSPFVYDTIRGATKTLYADSTSTQQTESGLTSFDNDGFTLGSNYFQNRNGDTYYAWAWKADDNEPTITGGPATAVYKFEDNLNDVGGNYNATASNVTYSTGKFNKSAVFNGTNAKVVFPSGTPFDASNAIRAISCWVKVPDSTARMVFYSASSSSNSQDYFQVDASRDYGILIGMRNGGSANSVIAYLGTGYITPNTWTHVVAQLSHYKQEFWINGVNQTANMTYSEEVGNISRTSWIGNISYDSSVIHNIGINRNSGTAYSEGEVDQMRLFSGPLSQLDIEKLYAEASSDNDNLSYVEPDEAIINANANAGFSIVKYKGNGVAGKQVPHGLSAAPDMIIAKGLDSSYNWMVYHSAEGANKHAYLNLSNAFEDPAGGVVSIWNDTTPNASTFSISSNINININDGDYIAYCFHSVAGYSKFGSYTGNGSSNSISGLGFQPDWILIKDTGAAESWRLFDSVRNAPNTFLIDAGGAETTDYGFVSFDSDGFTLGNNWYGRVNQNAHNYIYIAFKIN